MTSDGVAGGLRRAGPLAFAGAASNVAGLALTVALARLLSEREYGTYQQLTAVFLVLSMPGSALLVGVVRRVHHWEHLGWAARVGPWVAGTRRRALFGIAVLVIVVALVRGWVTDQLSIPSPTGLVAVVAGGGGWLLLSINRGLLQARARYLALAWNLALEVSVRVMLAVGLVAAGLDVEGTALSLVLSMAIADLDVRRSLRRRGRARADDAPVAHLAAAVEGPATPPTVVVEGDVPSLVADTGAALASLALLALLQNLDVIVVGQQDSDHSGAYGAISVACKALAYGAIVLSAYLLPEAAAATRAGGHALRQLAVAGGLVAVPATALLALALAVPRQLLELVFGEDLADGAAALATLALAMTCFAVTILCTHYLLGAGRREVVLLLVAGAIAGVGFLPLADGDFVPTARAMLALHGALALGALGLVARATRHLRPVRSPARSGGTGGGGAG